MESEYKFVQGDIGHCQKVLNQWKHEYDIEVMYIKVFDISFVVMLILRTKKVNEGGNNAISTCDN